MAGNLYVSPDLALPGDAITQSIALLAVRRAGKSNAAAVMAEQMYDAGLPWVAIDPKGDWWGLRSSKDGTGPGLPIPIFGGLHGDMPLLPEAGHLIAELIVEQNLTCVLDVSEFASKAAQMRFLTDLGDRLFRLHGRHPHPRHLFLEEADDFLPQRVMREMARCVGTWTKIVKQGGSRGLGCTIISQRSAVVNKDALTQIETLIALRTTSPQDRKAILDWVAYHDVASEVVDSLPGLDDGEAWVCSPHWLARHGLPAMQRIRFAQRSTFDSGATPTVAGAARPRPATLADVDLAALQSRMEAVAEKAAHDDPVKLRRQIDGLRRQLAAANVVDPAELRELRKENAELRRLLGEQQAREPERVEVPVVLAEDIARVQALITALGDLAGKVGEPADRLGEALRVHATPRPAPVRLAQPRATLTTVPAAMPAPPAAPTAPEPAAQLKAGARRMLDVLARQHPMKLTRKQLATLASMKVTGGTFGTYFSNLRTAGYITEDGGFITLTAAGFDAAGATPDNPVTADELREMWRGKLKAGARAMLDHLLGAYPEAVGREDLALAVGLEVTGGTFGTYLSTLRRNELVTEVGSRVQAADVFFMGDTDA